MNLRSLFRKQNDKSSSIYGLDHAILNLPIPPPSMWMNLGYWKDTSDFPTACAALLDQVLITASLLNENGDAIPHPPERRLRLLDVGIGCGDQSLRILGYKRGGTALAGDDRVAAAGENGNADTDKGRSREESPLFESYVGITSLPVQAEFASQRIAHLQLPPSAAAESKTNPNPNPRARIFCADAANPSTWTPELQSSLHAFQQIDEEEKERKTHPENWLLALDTLYHFHPSRNPLFNYTHSTLHASLMAFDLILPSNPTVSLWTRLLLRLLCLLTGTPYVNFLTQDEYTALLVRAGYDSSKIVFRDVSADVFAGISGFIKRRGEAVKGYGLGGGSMGKFRGAGALFGWWARTGVVRGVVVVARV